MASSVKLWALGLMSVAVTEKISYDKLERRLEELNYAYVSERKRDATDSNALVIYSTLLNFGLDYHKLGEVIFEVKGISAEAQQEHPSKSSVVVKVMENGVFVFYFLEAFDGVLKNIDEIVQMLQRGSMRFKIGQEVLDVEQAVQGILSILKVNADTVTTYSLTYIQKHEDIELKELYGAIEVDLTYDYVKEELAKEILKKDVSMLNGINFYLGINGAVIMYESEPVHFLPGIINFSYDAADRGIAQYLNDAKYTARISDALKFSPYLDYMVEIEPLRVEVTLLKSYDKRLKIGRKSKEDMAILKSELTEQLDFYYTLANTKYSGVSMALKVASQIMGIDGLNSLIEERMRLVGESVEIKHQLKLEFLNSIFTYLLAAFGFASLTMIFFFNYFRGINPALSVILIFGSTLIFLIFISLVLKIVSKSEKTIEK